MFNFIFKKKKIVLECFCTKPNALQYFPLAPAAKFLPDWWKKLPKSYEVEHENGIRFNRPTLKACDGFSSLYKRGFMIPLWSDLIVETDSMGFKWVFADGDTNQIGFHDIQQMSTEWQNYMQFKITSPWFIRERTGVKFAFIQPSYNQVKEIFDWHAIPGVVDFKYQHSTNINIVAPRGRRFEISAGRPLAHLIPLSDDDIELEIKIVDSNNMEDKMVINPWYPWFNGSYKKGKKIIESQIKCPFKKS